MVISLLFFFGLPIAANVIFSSYCFGMSLYNSRIDELPFSENYAKKLKF